VRGRGAPVTNLSHSASFHSFERITPSNRGIKQLDIISHFRFATIEDIADYQFSQEEIDAITDLLMQHFDVTGFVADTAITYLTDKRLSHNPCTHLPCPPVSE
jgi:hypothetical protein